MKKDVEKIKKKKNYQNNQMINKLKIENYNMNYKEELRK